MATESRRRDPDLEIQDATALYQSPYSYEFFQAVRLLQRMNRGLFAPGGFQPPDKEVVRFAAHQSLGFPASQIQSFTQRESGPPLMVVNFMGLTGPLGVLPTVYTAFIRERVRQRDTAMRDFFDIFNHRMISLFYRAWEKYRFTVAFEMGRRGGLSHYLLDLLGLGTPKLQNRQAVADETFIYYSGLVTQQPRSASALQAVLADYFEVPVVIEQFAGCWYPLGRSDQCELKEGLQISTKLGFGTVVGNEVWYQQSRVRVKLGPLPLKKYLEFLPGGSAHEPLRAITRLFSSQEFDFEAQLILKREDVPRCVLGQEGEQAGRLGWVTWANTRGLDRDPGDTVLRL